MNLLDDLSAQALIGAERRSPTLPAAPGALGELLIEIAGSAQEVETQVLRAAGAIGVCALAGYQPAVSTEPGMAPCPPETARIPADKALLSALRHILDEGPERLRVEALRRLTLAGCRLPPRLLPGALQQGRRSIALRPFVIQAAGQRGRWLADLNPDWRYLADSIDERLDPQVWETGALEQRQHFLARIRASEPARARTLLGAALEELNARERAKLLETLNVGLSGDDEDFIEPLLRDRGKDARQVAAGLLTMLPGSRYVGRMVERLAPCLKQERKLLRRVWALEAPEQFDPGWKDDALEENRPQSEPLGQRAWWLYQIARTIPLAWWERQTSLSAAELIQWAGAGDWGPALLRAWREALARERNADWAEALLDHPPVKNFNLDPWELIDVLPAPRREQRWLRLLENGHKKILPGDLLARVAQSLPLESPPLSPGFARKVLQTLKKRMTEEDARRDHALRTSLIEFACLIPAEAFTDATEGWPMDPAGAQGFAQTVARVLAVVEQRQTLIHHLAYSGNEP